MVLKVKNAHVKLSKRKIRKIFGKISDFSHVPNLTAVQTDSGDSFLSTRLDAVFNSVFPIDNGNATLEYVGYELEQPKYAPEECFARGTNHASLLLVSLRLIVWEVDLHTNARSVLNIKEQKVYVGELPVMTKHGTFVFNGAERVIVSQKHRAPGAFYYDDGGKKHPSGKKQYFARVIPYRGSWLDIEFDFKDLLYFRIDRRRKLPITTLLTALGYSRTEILDLFYNKIGIMYENGEWIAAFNPERFKGVKVYYDVIDAHNGEIIINADTKVTPRVMKRLQELSEGVQRYYIVPRDEVMNCFVAQTIELDDCAILADAGDAITEELLSQIEDSGIRQIMLLDIDFIRVGPYMRNTMILDKNVSKIEALTDIYRVLRPGEPSTPEAAENVFNALFFDQARYDLSVIGRMKINMKHSLAIDGNMTVLTRQDIVAIIKRLLDIKSGIAQVDDVDNLGNQRIRSVGELFENQLRLGLVRMSRSILERMNSIDVDAVMPYELVNSKVLMSLVREFFGRSQLSQFMDQTNPLAEVTHKRRISALGSGGVKGDRAGFEMRDVHFTHYGRFCPIETPEGANIGLINSLACYAHVNKYGFVESPYRVVKDCKLTDEIIYLSAIEEGRYVIATADVDISSDGVIVSDNVMCRCDGDFSMVHKSKVNLIDVSPQQSVSVAASLIPFLENDDANRALMGSNMQRQAVPLLISEAPFVGTGMEAVVAKDSWAVVVAKRAGYVQKVDSKRIVIRADEQGDDTSGIDIYTLMKFRKSNQGTCMNQRPIVKVGDYVEGGDVIADGPSTEHGELALGRNVLVAFVPWSGYNYEDSILLSERISKDDVFTSVHIQEFEVVARDMRLGPEEITRDIPQVGEEVLRDLDESGIVRIGARVKTGSILVGKTTPKSDANVTPEEKLLRAIFGDKASDAKDSSMRVPPGVSGVVVDVRVFTRRGVEKDERTIVQERMEIDRLAQDRDDEIDTIQEHVYSKLLLLLSGRAVVTGGRYVKNGTVLNAQILNGIQKRNWWSIGVDAPEVMSEIARIKAIYDACMTKIDKEFKSKVEKVQSGDDLPQGALKVVKVYLATKLKIQPGDKLAGRHGNKGVVSKIMPIEDMPFLEDGTPVDVVLNPLGVPSRMNIGQILETHLGWASANLGKQVDKALRHARKFKSHEKLRDTLLEIYGTGGHPKYAKQAVQDLSEMSEEALEILASNIVGGVPVASPVFDGIKADELDALMIRAGVDVTGQVVLYDGRTGEPFARKVTVGYAYILKLLHLADDKLHARSIGPYSLITQQPLGGKAHFGGQRFGEMECWALQAYGAAHTLQEILTVRSDDVTGRVKMYEAIVQGNSVNYFGVPESFNVTVKELRSLGLDVEMHEENDGDTK